MKSKKSLAIVFFISLLIAYNDCQSKDKVILKNINDYLGRTFQPDAPGGAVIVVRDYRTFFTAAYGLADVELAVPAEPDMIYAIGSMTKQFTAVSILLLAEQNKLNLSDDIRIHLPQYPMHERVITIENLLTHTSGIIDLFQIPEFGERLKDDVTTGQLIDYFKDKPLQFHPGEDYQYSNSGYALLGMIIEKISGHTYDQFVKENLFKPLEMNKTYVGSNENIMPKRVRGYFIKDGTYYNAPYFSITQQFAAGSIWSSVDDLARWNAGLLKGTIIKKETLNKAFSSFTLKNGQKTGYGYGWTIDRFYGSTLISHGGSSMGFRSHGIFLPAENVFIAVLVNSMAMDTGKNSQIPETIALNLLKLVLGKSIDERELVPIEMSEIELQKYVGVYQESENKYRTITRRGSQLYNHMTGFPTNAVYPLTPTDFFTNGPGRLEFVFDDQGKVVQANWRLEDGTLYVSNITDLPVPEPKQVVKLTDTVLQKFTGKYKSGALFSFQIEKGDNCLVITSKTFPTSTFYPESETTFFLENQDDVTIDFTKSKNGEIDGFIMRRNNKDMMVNKVE